MIEAYDDNGGKNACLPVDPKGSGKSVYFYIQMVYNDQSTWKKIE